MSTKAANYLALLDKARCEAQWSEVPELVRKARKHAPDRSCLTLTAETECAISQITLQAASAPTPEEAADHKEKLSVKIPQLQEAISSEATYLEDKFQAEVCLGWLHWALADYSEAWSCLPKLAHVQFESLDSVSETTITSAMKAAYLSANTLIRTGERNEALAAFQSGLPFLARVWSGQPIHAQLRYWSEMYLTEFCMLSAQMLHGGEASLEASDSLTCFRAWAKYWEALSGLRTGGHGFKGSVPRRQVWNEYYMALSRVLEENLPVPTGYVGKITGDMPARTRLRIELKNAEASYQALLMAETKFPSAHESRPEVEAFVQLVVKNWAILCGRGWREQDLGQGGRSSISRGVLDTLYLAAANTYHSPAVLRSLFLVHLSLAEFDLAFKAFDSYMEIIHKAKARVEKTGIIEDNLDDDGTVLETMAQCIMALCRYGYKQSAEKARQLGAELEDWLAKLPQNKGLENGASAHSDIGDKSHPEAAVEPQIIALAWQAIGLAHAHWSRITHEAASRTEIQAKAIRCLRRSLASDLGRSKDVRSFFALALLLAERRDLSTAIELVRSALMTGKGQEESYHLLCGSYWHERSLIALWNLLALLLSARQDYLMAARACEGALEQFKNPAILFGTTDPNLGGSQTRGEPPQAKGLVDEMDDVEKENILEVKITQLALIEVLEGPEVAVNASYELLTLFQRLFGNIAAQSTLSLPKAEEPPKTSSGRSVRASLFGSKTDRSRPPTRQISIAATSQTSPSSPISPTRPMTAQTMASIAPTIQVTEENGGRSPRTKQGGSVQRQQSESGRRNSLRKRDRSQSRRRASSVGDAPILAPALAPATIVDGESFFTPAAERAEIDFASSGKAQASRTASFSRSHIIRSPNSQLSTNTKSTERSDITVEGIHVSTNILPLVQFPKDTERSQRTAILIRVWLIIAGFYRRAGMLSDCRGAISEAQKLVQGLEAEATRDPSGSSGIKGSSRWAEHKSIDDLWGDIWTELGLLSQAKDELYTARSDFESALTHCPDHPGATVGLSNILLDVYSEKLRPAPAIPSLNIEAFLKPPSKPAMPAEVPKAVVKTLPSTPLGLGGSSIASSTKTDNSPSTPDTDEDLPAPYKATRLPLVDRLAARDRAFALLSGLTRLGSGWNYSEAWFALARAHEESGQPDKAKEVLWWCVELEEAAGVRDWRSLGSGGYVV
ncbi:hypothetical protein B0I35DRAFT_473963 [Stachybotrys elegans]|uniref:Filamentation protein n=1 Tax=Stachybotrys elegans TaxID=80388 RepID=A0A8K0T8M5_9HYPO|nr:hypothetical protein B0I35DRAFT_473963 [Stachybotrys elegans]